jgi:hypothetical protein
MKITACLLSGIAFLLTGGVVKAQKKDLPPANTWAPWPVNADGVLNEWASPLKFYDDASHLSYEISNDSVNLYVAISTMDAAAQVSIMRAGVSLGVNIKGKKKILQSVTYPQIDGSVLYAQRRNRNGGGNNGGYNRNNNPDDDNGDNMDTYNRNNNSGQPHGRPDVVYRQLQPYMTYIGVSGLEGVNDGTVDIRTHRTGLNAGLMLVKDTLNVEMVIPLAKLGVTPAYAKNIAYSLTVNHDNAGGGGGNRGGGMRGPRMGMGVGMGMGMGMGGFGGSFGVPIGGGGRRGMNNSNAKSKPAVRFKQALAKPQAQINPPAQAGTPRP